MKFSSWFMLETPKSEFQALVQQIYIGWCRFKSNPVAMVGLCIVAGLFVIAAFAPVITTASGLEQDLSERLLFPNGEHWLGTDELGRDVYQRIVWGSRVTLKLVALVTIVTIPIGMVIGIVSGYFGGLIDSALMRITDIFLAFPKLILALAFVAALGPGLMNAVLAISLTAWAPYARIVRAETLAIRNAEYIACARMQGASTFRILFRHVTPMCLPTVIVRLTLDMASVILVAAALGFLGLGAQPPMPEWGAMVSTGRQFIFDQWWVATMPGIAILVVSMGFNLLGDGLRDVLDPRSGK